jgi:hypothetical protein
VAASCSGGSRDDGDTAPATDGTAGEPAVAREASDTGVTEDAITIGIISSDVERLAQLGFSSNVGDVRSLYENFLVSMNASDGINGRRIDWVYEEFDTVGGAASMEAACDRLFERATPFVVVTSGGFVDAMSCVTNDHDTPVIATDAFPASAFTNAGGNLFTIPATSQVSLGVTIDRLVAHGDLTGKKIGVLYGDRPGMVESVDSGLIPALERHGLSLDAKAQITGESSDPAAFAQFPTAIATLQSAGIDTLVVVHDAFLVTNFMTTAAKSGYTPKLVGSDYLHAADSTLLPYIENYRAEALFDGMLGVTYTRTGDDTSGEQADPLDLGCSSRYDAARGPDSPKYGEQRWAMLAIVCNQIDIAIRGIRGAGPNPTQDAFRQALTAAPKMHLGFGGQGTFAEGKQDAADEFRVIRYDAATASFVPVEGYADAR